MSIAFCCSVWGFVGLLSKSDLRFINFDLKRVSMQLFAELSELTIKERQVSFSFLSWGTLIESRKLTFDRANYAVTIASCNVLPDVK